MFSKIDAVFGSSRRLTILHNSLQIIYGKCFTCGESAHVQTVVYHFCNQFFRLDAVDAYISCAPPVSVTSITAKDKIDRFEIIFFYIIKVRESQSFHTECLTLFNVFPFDFPQNYK
jgi:hypothetical protein